MSIKYIKKDNELLLKLIDFIKESGYKDGDRILAERALAKELNASRNSLRECLKILQTMDVLNIQKRSGIYINSISNLYDDNPLKWNKWISLHKDKVMDLYNIRTALEVKAIELIPTNDIIITGEKLKECTLQLDIDNCSETDFIDYDIKFHSIIWKACNNKALLDICLDITNTIYDERSVIASDAARKSDSIAEHKVIIESFLNCDKLFIIKIYEAHSDSVSDYVIKTI